VALMFWQQAIGEAADRILTPRPIHRHSGGMIQDCYSVPAEWYGMLTERIGRPFNLGSYWGPLAGRRSSEWIVGAIRATLEESADAPTLILGYVPHLDYDLQRFGPSHPRARRALEMLMTWLEQLHAAARAHGYETLFFGDYAMTDIVGPPIFPNRALCEAGLFSTRAIRGRLYPDILGGEAMAVADHEVALVYARDAAAAVRARDVLKNLSGVSEIVETPPSADEVQQTVTPDFVLVAEEGRWFAYPWWERRGEAPDYASHVDIHNKPGYDPCELFFGFPPFRVSMDASRVRGTHGRAGPGRKIAWTSSAPLHPREPCVTDIARALAAWLTEGIE